MHLILTGATGLVGSAVLDAMLQTTEITKISILSRRPVPMAEDRKDPRVNVIIHRDFENYDSSVLEQLRGAGGCVWALGISQTQVGPQEYVKITKDYTLAAARAFSTITPDEGIKPFHFIYVSGEGATQKPGRFTPIFGRVKGETEALLGDMSTELAGKLHADSARPSYVDASTHEAIKPYIPNKGLMMNAMEVALGPLIRRAYRSQHSPTPFLGDCLTQMAMGKLDGKIEGDGAFKLGSGWVLRNWAMRRMMGQ